MMARLKRLGQRIGSLWEDFQSADATHDARQTAESLTFLEDAERAYHRALAELVGQIGEIGPENGYPMDTAPRDGTTLRLLVDYTDWVGAKPLKDDSVAWTIGHNSFDHTGEDKWEMAGWCWSHDHYTDGFGMILGWLPFHGGGLGETPALKALRLYDEWDNLPTDRGGRNGTKGRAWQAFMDAKAAALGGDA